ncbi:hypothetical protein [Nonomuraea lactucae]|uniref:hypothetical protein n=1 Tax=Nonomuraea lactucae TaxID=2249762 RepID=UPI000DE33E46|nr:hypothetical protein [Nonomuraea lactucae]
MDIAPKRPAEIGYRFAAVYRPIRAEDTFHFVLELRGSTIYSPSNEFEDLAEAIFAGFEAAAKERNVTHVIIARIAAGDIFPVTFRSVPVVGGLIH